MNRPRDAVRFPRVPHTRLVPFHYRGGDDPLPDQGRDRPPQYLDEFYLPATDDWYPCFIRDTVRVSVMPLRQREPTDPVVLRVCVWGSDDAGMELDSDPVPVKDVPARAAELVRFARSIPNPVTQEWLLDHGFQWA